MTRSDKRRISSSTSDRLSVQTGACGDGKRRTSNLSSIPCPIKPMACKLGSCYVAPHLILTPSHRFRWVVCQFDCLCRCFPASIRSTLADLPDGLDETYE